MSTKEYRAEWQRRNRDRRNASTRKWRAANKRKVRAKNVANYWADPDAAKDRVRITRYGMKPGQYAQMVEAQRGLCAACGLTPDKKGLCVDHCHETGTVRGLLCHHCNAALGLLRECPQRMQALKDYIGRHNWLSTT